MDDLELEARLRTHLHRRLDDAPIPVGLASNVSQALATAVRPIGLATRTGRVRLGWAAVAAAVILAVAAVGMGKGLGPNGPGGTTTPTPGAPSSTDRRFLVLPANGTLVGKAEASLANEVLSARLRAFGIANFTSAGSELMSFWVPAGGPTDASIRTLLSATGDVRVVPLPAADYGAGMRVATLGAPLPKDEPALFGWDGIQAITNVAPGTSDGRVHGAPLLGMTLKAPAARAFADFVDAHVGETYAVVVDGRVALLPTAQPAASDGSFNLSNGSIPAGSAPTEGYLRTAAILVGGLLPEAWRGASVPVLITKDAAIASALAARRGSIQGASQDEELSTTISGDAWQVVWNVEVLVPECPANASCAWAPGPYLVKVDAVTGAVFHVGSLEP
jgi:hypothetical protein